MSISSTHSQIQPTTLTSITVPMNLGYMFNFGSKDQRYKNE